METVDYGLKRARHHLSNAKKIQSVCDDWAHVAAFYSAYHSVRHALMEDPVFRDLKRLQSVDPRLSIRMRETTHHSGNINTPRDPGINQLVKLFYGRGFSHRIDHQYIDLHSTSVMIRYKDGAVQATVGESLSAAEMILERVSSGLLVAT